MTPVCREQLREIKKATKINTLNCTLKCSEWRKINSVAWQTIPNANNPFSKKLGPDRQTDRHLKSIIRHSHYAIYILYDNDITLLLLFYSTDI